MTMWIRKKTALVLSSVFLAWAGTALLGVPKILQWVRTDQARAEWGFDAEGRNSDACYARGFPIAPLLVLVFEGCSDDLDSGEFSGGYASAHLHLWFLAGQSRITTLWLTEDTVTEPPRGPGPAFS